MSYTVSATDLGSIRLNEPEEVNAVLQNIALILATPKGSVPLYRDFGLSMDYIDLPTISAKPRLIVAVREAIEQWEPRAEFVNVSIEEDALNGRLIPKVEVKIHAEES